MERELLINAVYGAWKVAQALCHQWGDLQWEDVFNAIGGIKTLRGAAKKIAALTWERTTPGPLGYGIDSPTPARGRFVHTTASGRSEFEIWPGDPATIYQTVTRPGGAIAVRACATINLGGEFETVWVDVYPPARRRHIDAVLFDLSFDDGTVCIGGEPVEKEELLALLREREMWDVAAAYKDLRAAIMAAGVHFDRVEDVLRRLIESGKGPIEAARAALVETETETETE